MIENKVPNPPAIMVAGLLVLQLLQPPDSGLDCDSRCCAAREGGAKKIISFYKHNIHSLEGRTRCSVVRTTLVFVNSPRTWTFTFLWSLLASTEKQAFPLKLLLCYLLDWMQCCCNSFLFFKLAAIYPASAFPTCWFLSRLLLCQFLILVSSFSREDLGQQPDALKHEILGLKLLTSLPPAIWNLRKPCGELVHVPQSSKTPTITSGRPRYVELEYQKLTGEGAGYIATSHLSCTI